MNKSLYESTIEMMRDPRVPVSQACRDLGISERWWFRVVNGSIRDPGVRRMERLNAYLVDKRETAA
jgi:hypothetical protein